jgi:protein-S-isoprenylcysteine O-methyltransferase Ste14
MPCSQQSLHAGDSCEEVKKMETRPTGASRTRWLYFIPLLFLVLGLVFYMIANARPDIPSGPITPMEDFVWTSALVFFGLGILGGIIAIGLYIWRAAVAHASRQSPQAQELSNRDLRAQRD